MLLGGICYGGVMKGVSFRDVMALHLGLHFDLQPLAVEGQNASDISKKPE